MCQLSDFFTPTQTPPPLNSHQLHTSTRCTCPRLPPPTTTTPTMRRLCLLNRDVGNCVPNIGSQPGRNLPMVQTTRQHNLIIPADQQPSSAWFNTGTCPDTSKILVRHHLARVTWPSARMCTTSSVVLQRAVYDTYLRSAPIGRVDMPSLNYER
ncbi:hypothetical protein FRC08_015907 [Ceratobasidium sp. 394]|nr:hypothetical protein FRC08_015907 [Ceratobasidium sp. 394]